eukprot:TRINITY_DN22268_c0_g1_i1.p1 TRINITY_DN22268_c0_g1~~TRINITY_DN22268_c0_g1_i1.p1  ORF type:complete len:179 (-),score=42.15 TRINITY_DN22268_c0_g1_i1:76-612(-)
MFFFFFFNDTATTEIYTLHIVGSVRCVQETVILSPKEKKQQQLFNKSNILHNSIFKVELYQYCMRNLELNILISRKVNNCVNNYYNIIIQQLEFIQRPSLELQFFVQITHHQSYKVHKDYSLIQKQNYQNTLKIRLKQQQWVQTKLKRTKQNLKVKMKMKMNIQQSKIQENQVIVFKK